MGYHTDFYGQFEVSPALKPEHAEYLKAFGYTRRMLRNATIAATMPDPVREAVGLPVGEHGAYFVGGGGYAGQEHDASIIDYNTPPPGQPGLWCNWEPQERDGVYDRIGWDGMEKFYNYTEWLQYLITHFLEPWGYTVSGSVKWDGDEQGDTGTIVVDGNRVLAEREKAKGASDDH